MMNETVEPQRLQNWITGMVVSFEGDLVYHQPFQALEDRCWWAFLSLHTGKSSGYNSENQLLGGSAPFAAGATGGFACF